MRSPSGGFASAIAIAMALGASAADPAHAGCAQAELQREFEHSLRRALICAERTLRAATARNCAAIAPPACAADEFAQIIELVGGLPAQAVGRGRQSRCQSAVYRGTMDFVKRRMRERTAGHRRQRRSLAAIRVPRQCEVTVADTPAGTLPRLGGRCSGAAGAAGEEFRNVQIRDCLRPALEGLVGAALDLPAVRPNVVLVITDDQRADTLDLMPSVQKLARQGVSFANAFTTTPICAPARAGILTGQHATSHGVIANLLPDGQGGVTNGAFALDESSTLGTWFQAEGYRTAHFGKYLNGYSFMSPAIPLGWDDWRVFVSEQSNFFDYAVNDNGVIRQYGSAAADYSTDVIRDFALEFIRANAASPFLLVFTPYAPHGPSTPAPRHAGSLAALPLWRPPSWYEDIADKPSWFRFFAVNNLNQLIQHDVQVQKQRETLLAVDEALAAIDARLERLGLTDNTLVVFMSDHGLLWGEHRWTGKQVPYEESIRIPLVLRYPLRLPIDEVRDEFAVHYDVTPTLTDLAGVPATHPMDGRSLVDAIEGAPDWRQDFVVQHFVGGFTVPPWDLLRTDRYKYVRHPNHIDELYDLAADPYELDNLAEIPQYSPLLADLADRLDELLAQ